MLSVQVLLGRFQGRAKRAFPVRFHGLRLVLINIFSFIILVIGLVAQWITRLTTDQKIPGSNPGKVVFLHGHEKKIQYFQKELASVGIEPATLALLAPRSNQLS